MLKILIIGCALGFTLHEVLTERLNSLQTVERVVVHKADDPSLTFWGDGVEMAIEGSVREIPRRIALIDVYTMTTWLQQVATGETPSAHAKGGMYAVDASARLRSIHHDTVFRSHPLHAMGLSSVASGCFLWECNKYTATKIHVCCVRWKYHL